MKGNNMQKGNAMVETLMTVAVIVLIGTVLGSYGIAKLDSWLVGHDKKIEVCK